MNAARILALDFDGVICDGMAEYWQTAWRTYTQVWQLDRLEQNERLFRRHDGDLFLLRKVFCRIKPREQPQVDEARLRFRQRDAAIGLEFPSIRFAQAGAACRQAT